MNGIDWSKLHKKVTVDGKSGTIIGFREGNNGVLVQVKFDVRPAVKKFVEMKHVKLEN